MKTILVTGGAGYIGSQTVRELIKENFKVVVVDNLSAGHKEAVDRKAILEIADLSNQKKIDQIFKKHLIEGVIDFAALLAVGESMAKPIEYLENNVLNIIKLLDVMSQNNCRYIIKSSTAATYGNPTKRSDIPWKEVFTHDYKPKKSALLEGKWQDKMVSGNDFFEHFINLFHKNISGRNDLRLNQKEISTLKIPLSIYGLTKLLDEIIMNKYDKLSGIKNISLRYFNVCGADPKGDLGEDKPKPTTLMTLCFWQILNKIPLLQIFGNDYPTPDGTGIRDYIHPLDLAHGHIKALRFLEKTNQSEIFNLGTGQGSSVIEVIKSVEKAVNKKINIKIASRRSGDTAISVADPTKANKILKWRAKFDLKTMAKTAWNWHSRNPNGFIKY